MRKREIIIADEGKVLTDGKTYGTEWLALAATKPNWAITLVDA